MLDLAKLNPQQQHAAKTVDGPVLVLAGAGSGKTRVIVYRIGSLIGRGISPKNILAVTFTNKAAREMRERVGKLLGAAATKGLTVSTFHSLCVRILREDIAALGYTPNFVIYDESDQLGIVRKIIGESIRKDEKADPKVVLALISRAKSTGRFHDDLVRYAVQRYNSALRNANAVDFDDLLLLAVELLEKHPKVLAKYQDRYRYMLVDEYQDTNHSQFTLLKLLAGKRQNVCVVGDDDQSIYGWRGAQLSNILEFEKHFPRPAIIKLEQNYRSTNTILRAANAVISHNTGRRAKDLWSRNGDGQPIDLYTLADDKEEAETIVNLVQQARFADKVPYEHQAILYRTNGQSRVFEEALRHARVPYRLIGGQSFYDRREIKDILAYLKLLVNPEDDASLLRVINVPARGLGETTVALLLGWSHEKKSSVFVAMNNPECLERLSARAQESARALVALIEKYRVGGEGKLGARAKEFIAEIGYVEEIRRTCRDPEDALNRTTNVQEMATAIVEFELANPNCGLRDYLDEVALAGDDEAEEDEKQGSGVTLITLHSCKGLEFPHVYLVGLEDGLLPHERSKDEGGIEEERRLFYVGITRAMKTLRISHARSRTKFGEATLRQPSPFLKELPAALVERKAGPDRNAPPPPEMASAFFAQFKQTAAKDGAA